MDLSRFALHGTVNNMGCNNCKDKASMRHNPTVVVKGGDLDAPTQIVEPTPVGVRTGKAFALDPELPDMPPNPHEAFMHAKSLSYDDIMRRQGDQQKRASLEVETMYREMTDAMRQFHVVSLLSVANYENLAMPGVSPDQAVIALKAALDREDFKEINNLYPTLKSQVDRRHDDLMSKKIVL